MGVDLDDIRKLADNFATESRRKNLSQKTVDGYLIRIGYFADFLEDQKLPTSAPNITRDHIGTACIEDRSRGRISAATNRFHPTLLDAVPAAASHEVCAMTSRQFVRAR
ncbi:hypothetical protein [Nocardia beijingensis]|uniref:Core-binding (CB) domain-containing protein n=1 Tax=Nocardia beijingensis TaxID=95162 RepID=A0ABW7WGU0_9NOCA